MMQNQTGELTRQSGTQISTHREDRTGPTHAEKLRSQVARAAWSIARDTGFIHVGLQKVQQYEEALATIKEAIG
jgi:phage shock protein A